MKLKILNLKLDKVFFFCLFLSWSCCMSAQVTLHNKAKKAIELKSSLDLISIPTIKSDISIIKHKNIYKVEHLPIFCKFEHKLSKNSNVNVRMRLGSLDYVDKLEGKN